MPHETGAVTPSMKVAVIAASTALPPLSRTCIAARAVLSFSAATAKWFPTEPRARASGQPETSIALAPARRANDILFFHGLDGATPLAIPRTSSPTDHPLAAKV